MPSMAATHGGILYYVVTAPKEDGTDSGWDNPFRPDGDLSREADEIVELIKGGKPITPTPGSTAPELPSVDHSDRVDGVNQSPAKAVSVPNQNQAPNAAIQNKVGANGTAPVANNKQPASVEVKRETIVQPGDASQVEHIVLKKKPKCKCCVIQ